MSPVISTQNVGEFAAQVASDAPTPGGGAVAGAVAALAAALVGMVGRYSVKADPESTYLPGLVEWSDRVRARALVLADADADAYGKYHAATHLVGEARKPAMRAAADKAADVPVELVDVAAQLAVAAEQLVARGNPRLRADACAAALLASSVATAAQMLVAENLPASPLDPRRVRAAEGARAAVTAAERALANPGLRQRSVPA